MYIRVRVIPDARKDEVEETGPNRYEVKVKAPAERGLANEAVLTLMARHLNLPRAHLRLISGHHERSKMISVRE